MRDEPCPFFLLAWPSVGSQAGGTPRASYGGGTVSADAGGAIRLAVKTNVSKEKLMMKNMINALMIISDNLFMLPKIGFSSRKLKKNLKKYRNFQNILIDR